MIHEQGSQEWFDARLGKLTGSGCKEWVCKSGKLTDSAHTYIMKRLEEIKSGEPEYVKINDAMVFGQEQEPIARKHYTRLNGIEVEEVGFIEHPTMPYLGVSLDGKILIEDVKGTIEIKTVTNDSRHIHLTNCLIDSNDAFKDLNPKAYWQAQCGLMVTDSEFCDFISFCPFYTKDQGGMFVYRMKADPNAFATIKHSAEMCHTEMTRMAKVLGIEMPEYAQPKIQLKNLA